MSEAGPVGFTHAACDNGTVNVGAAARDWSLPRRWLRDNCRCSEFRIQQTSERRFLPVGTALDADVAEAGVADGVLHKLTETRGGTTR